MREIVLETERKLQLIEITDQIRDALGDMNGASAALVYVPHTTAGVAINERIDPELVTDLENAFQRVVGDDWEWTHEDEDGPNAPSHARASLASSPTSSSSSTDRARCRCLSQPSRRGTVAMFSPIVMCGNTA